VNSYPVHTPVMIQSHIHPVNLCQVHALHVGVFVENMSKTAERDGAWMLTNITRSLIFDDLSK
jgi:hypothetical protein